MDTGKLLDELVKGVGELKKEYDELNATIPGLAVRKSELKKEIDALNREFVSLQEQRDSVADNLKVHAADMRNQIQEERDEFEAERDLALKNICELTEALEGDQGTVERAKAELEAKGTELAEREQKIEEHESELAERRIKLMELQEAINTDTAISDKRVEDIEKQRELAETILKEAMDNFAKSDEMKLEADKLLADARNKAQKADKRLSGVEERLARINLLEDEHKRLEILLKDRENRLAKKETALKDREAVYRSH